MRKKVEDIKEEYNFEDINNTLDGEHIPQQLELFWVATTKIL